MKTIGILGGMGPESSALFYQKIIDICHKKYQAVQDTDYPPIFIYSLPLKGFDESGIVNKKLVLKQLIAGVKKLETAGSDFIVMPCNTVHCFIKELRKEIKIPILSIVEEAQKELMAKNIKKVGLLAAETTYNLGLYDKVLKQNGVEVVLPNKANQKLITKKILKIMAGKFLPKDKNDIVKIINRMKNQQAKAVVLGCTELPIVIKQTGSPLKIFSSLQILAEKAVGESRK